MARPNDIRRFILVQFGWVLYYPNYSIPICDFIGSSFFINPYSAEVTVAANTGRKRILPWQGWHVRVMVPLARATVRAKELRHGFFAAGHVNPRSTVEFAAV